MARAGKERNTTEIWVCLRRLGKTLTDLAKESGVTVSKASDTIHGTRNYNAVLRTLISWGVPEALLDLPKGFKEREAA